MKTILGYRRRPRYRPRRGKAPTWEVTVERPVYDLTIFKLQFRGKQLVRRIEGTRRYEPVPSGLKTLAALIVLRTHVLKPLLAGAEQTTPFRAAQHLTALDRHYAALRTEMHGVFHELGIAG